jgi:steroid delta-isomerase-like uncharacterized protein
MSTQDRVKIVQGIYATFGQEEANQMPDKHTVSELERNKAISHRFNEEVKNKHNLDAIDELFSPDFVNHSEIPGFVPTREGVKEFFAQWVNAFPDLTCTIIDTIAEGNKVVDYFTLEGTHRGEFMGLPATGKRIKYNGMHIFSFEKGKITGHWNVLDLLTMMMQLGVVPPG